jgi:hypothetical protein
MKINPVTKVYKEACCLLENEWKSVGNDFLPGLEHLFQIIFNFEKMSVGVC